MISYEQLKGETAPQPWEIGKLEHKECVQLADRETGTVKGFSDAKGYGFISRDSGDDVFVHFSAIASQGFRTLREGQRVEFSVEQTPKGLQAVEVKVL